MFKLKINFVEVGIKPLKPLTKSNLKLKTKCDIIIFKMNRQNKMYEQ